MNSYILFYSSNYALWARKLLNNAGFSCEMVAVPREVSSDCGYCLKILKKDKELIRKMLESSNIPIEKIVDLEV